ncbi:coiled-coil domain-containing protein 22, partial [Melospiza melodia melodia]|uniref:coiled-coil domain-containing protein 22 n=1 Tax=Melospiza melodia melodia TaxID=1914991 RepID=UPI002FD2930E
FWADFGGFWFCLKFWGDFWGPCAPPKLRRGFWGAPTPQILEDTRALQKEINALVGKLERTFSVTDELLFRDAKRDEVVRKAYKYLAALHENCAQLIRTIEDTGTIQREIRDLEEQIEVESSSKLPAAWSGSSATAERCGRRTRSWRPGCATPDPKNHPKTSPKSPQNHPKTAPKITPKTAPKPPQNHPHP